MIPEYYFNAAVTIFFFEFMLMFPINLNLIRITSFYFNESLSLPCTETNFFGHITSSSNVQISPWLQTSQLLIQVGLLTFVLFWDGVVQTYLMVKKIPLGVIIFTFVSVCIYLTPWVLNIFVLVQVLRLNGIEGWDNIQESKICCGIRSYIDNLIPNLTTHVHQNFLTPLIYKSNKNRFFESNPRNCCCFNPDRIISYTNLQVYNGTYFIMRVGIMFIWLCCCAWGRRSEDEQEQRMEREFRRRRNHHVRLQNVENPNLPLLPQQPQPLPLGSHHHHPSGDAFPCRMSIPPQGARKPTRQFSRFTSVDGQNRTPNNNQELSINPLFENRANTLNENSVVEDEVSHIQIQICHPLEPEPIHRLENVDSQRDESNAALL